ncbi:MAG: DsbA family protein [Thermoleophilia bacterium]|nr:DsbA family protein [Thermoleophilia bacterium]
MTTPDDAPRLIYVGDPMCSWCWGFAPVLEQIRDSVDVPFEIVLGGLRPGPAATEVDDTMRRFLSHHWDQVEQATGQPFDHSSLERKGFVYDTEPPSVAVVAMRELEPQKALPYFVRLQHAFYADGKDLGDAETLAIAAKDLVDLSAFLELLASPTTRRSTWEDFNRARQMGISGFPTLVGTSADGLEVLSPGYLPYDRLAPAIDDWLGRS